jgi:uncharacterized protein YbaP (TraB family)
MLRSLKMAALLWIALQICTQVVFGVATVNHPLLWKVTTASGNAYLLGSIHFGRQDMYPLDPMIDRIFEAADALVVEANLLAVAPETQALLLRNKGLYPEGDNLKANLTPATWQALEAAVQRYGIPAAVLQRQEPWLTALTLSTLAFQRAGYSEALGIDLHFLRKAQRQKKPIIELESVATQLSLFDTFTAQEQEAFLLVTLQELNKGARSLEAIVAAWREGDAETIDTLLNETLHTSPELERIYRLLLVDRNVAMADKITAFMQQGKSVFVVVGAGHLVGEKGLVELFKKKGYQV